MKQFYSKKFKFYTAQAYNVFILEACEREPPRTPFTKKGL